MALAEARAVWQRTANRCLAQEDAKRAPKLACCSSVPPSVKQADVGPTSASGGQGVPNTTSIPFNLSSSYSNLSPSSKWWLNAQPNHGYQKSLMDEQFDSVESLIGQTTAGKSSCENQCKNMATGDQKDFGVKEDKSRTFSTWNWQDSVGFEVKESSWIEVDKNIPWWRTADTDELASLVAQRSLDHIENCDLPSPQNTHVKKDVDDGVSSSLLGSKLGVGSHHHYNNHLHKSSSLTHQNPSHKLEGQAESSTDKHLRDTPTHETTQKFSDDATKAQLMEALCHSQTRAREAERAAEQACAEKEHVVKLVFRQASQLFAYKQWLHLLQLETMYLQFINNTSHSVSGIFPPILPWNPQSTRKIRKNETSSCKKRDKQCCPEYEAGIAVFLALGLGLAGAGFLLGWTIGWILPTW